MLAENFPLFHSTFLIFFICAFFITWELLRRAKKGGQEEEKSHWRGKSFLKYISWANERQRRQQEEPNIREALSNEMIRDGSRWNQNFWDKNPSSTYRFSAHPCWRLRIVVKFSFINWARRTEIRNRFTHSLLPFGSSKKMRFCINFLDIFMGKKSVQLFILYISFLCEFTQLWELNSEHSNLNFLSFLARERENFEEMEKNSLKIRRIRIELEKIEYFLEFPPQKNL